MALLVEHYACSILVMTIFPMWSGFANLFKSRYAMDVPVYAAKYEEGATKLEPRKKLKQTLDARHVEGLSGGYLPGAVFGTTIRSPRCMAQNWALKATTSWFSSRMALARLSRTR